MTAAQSARERSHWGWGWADRFPDAETRKGLSAQLSLMTGFTGGEPHEPVPLREVKLPTPRVACPDALADLLSDDAEDRIRHTYGRAYPDLLRGFLGDFSSAPDLVATPGDESDLVRLVDWAARERVALVPVGGATSVVGGVDTRLEDGYRGVAAVSMRRFDRVLEVDRESLTARIQAGASGPAIESQLAEHGLTLRHFPQSFEFSTLGGWLATRAGGHFATVYTHIDDLTQSMRVLTPAGVFESQRLPASGAGPSPDRLMLGSEGTLGFITEAWMRVRPRPTRRAKADLFFSDWDATVAAVREISQSGLFPSHCRVLDKREAALNAVAFDGRHVLLLGFESAGADVDGRLQQAIDIASRHGGDCPAGPQRRNAGEGDGQAAETWRQAFLDAPYLQSTLLSVGVIADTFETCCPWDRFDGLHRAIVKNVRAAMKQHCDAGFLSCRFTHVYPDGPAPYFTWLAPARRGEEIDQWRAIKKAASDTIREHGGTITHHHAVGRIHREWAEDQRPELFTAALRSVKQTLDPDAVLNPGVLIAPEDGRA
ncbi:MAG: FAD-binding oxidoreductase [Acidobacteriota bacterium]